MVIEWLVPLGWNCFADVWISQPVLLFPSHMLWTIVLDEYTDLGACFYRCWVRALAGAVLGGCSLRFVPEKNLLWWLEKESLAHFSPICARPRVAAPSVVPGIPMTAAEFPSTSRCALCLCRPALGTFFRGLPLGCWKMEAARSSCLPLVCTTVPLPCFKLGQALTGSL